MKVLKWKFKIGPGKVEVGDYVRLNNSALEKCGSLASSLLGKIKSIKDGFGYIEKYDENELYISTNKYIINNAIKENDDIYYVNGFFSTEAPFKRTVKNEHYVVGFVISPPTAKNSNLKIIVNKTLLEQIKYSTIKNVEIKSSLPYILSTNHLNDLADFCYEESKRKGWHTEKELNLAAFLTNLHGEISELWEAYRKGKLNELCDKAEEMSKHGIEPLTCMEEELADIFIRTEDLCKTYNIDITKAIKNKILYNRKRPHRNGGKLI